MEISTVDFLGLPFINLSGPELLETLKEAVHTYQPLKVCYVDAHILFQTLFSKKKREFLETFSIIVPRGAFLIKKIQACYPDYAYKYQDTPDLVSPLLSTYKDTHHSFMFFGGSQLGLNKLGVNLQASFPGVTLMGLYSETFIEARNEDVRAMIRKGDVRVVYLGMGAPKDERWVLENQDILENTVAICVDRDIRSWVGETRDIPLDIRRKGKEKSYQLLRNPFRVFLAYQPVVISIGAFFLKLRAKKVDHRQEK